MPYISDFPFRFGPAPCCCGDATCDPFQDDFDRPNSNDVGSDWNEQSGQWEILDGELHEKVGGGGTAGAQIFGTNPVSAAAPGQMFIRVKIMDASIGDIFSIFAACETSSSVGSGVEVTFEKTDTYEWTVTIVGGSAEGTVSQTTSDADPLVYVCVDSRVDMVTAGLQNSTDEKAWDDNLDPGDGRYYALGHDNVDNGAKFDTFYAVELHTATDDCTSCVCQCLEYGLKRSLVAEIIDVEAWANGNDLEPCDGQTFTLEYDFDGTAGPAWYGTWTNAASPPGAFTVNFILECSGGWSLYPDDPGYNIKLTFSSGTWPLCFEINDAVCSDVSPIGAESTCSPLSLVYGWFYTTFDIMPPTDISRYKIRITEA